MEGLQVFCFVYDLYFCMCVLRDFVYLGFGIFSCKKVNKEWVLVHFKGTEFYIWTVDNL